MTDLVWLRTGRESTGPACWADLPALERRTDFHARSGSTNGLLSEGMHVRFPAHDDPRGSKRRVEPVDRIR